MKNARYRRTKVSEILSGEEDGECLGNSSV